MKFKSFFKTVLNIPRNLYKEFKTMDKPDIKRLFKVTLFSIVSSVLAALCISGVDVFIVDVVGKMF